MRPHDDDDNNNNRSADYTLLPVSFLEESCCSSLLEVWCVAKQSKQMPCGKTPQRKGGEGSSSSKGLSFDKQIAK